MYQPEIIIKTIIIGNSGVGKTSLAKKLTNNHFKHNETTTIGVDFFNLDTLINKKKIRMQIWDTAGNEKFKHLIKSYFRNNSICYIVYDVTNLQSFLSVDKWINDYKFINPDPNTIIVILANKTDIEEKRKISKEQGLLLAKKYNTLFYEISAKNSVDLYNIIKEPVQNLLEIYKNNLLSFENNGFKYINLNTEQKTKCCTIQ